MAAAAAALLVLTTGGQAGAAQPDGPQVYEVTGAATAQQRTAVARTGADILDAEGATTTVIANPGEAAQLRAQGFGVKSLGKVNRPQGTEAVLDFPAGYTGYHTYAETQTELQKAVANYPALTKLGSAGNSYEGRALSMIKISDNAAADENEPEVLFTCNQHAREHLTVEMCLRIVQRLTSQYATNSAVKRLVDSAEIWVIPSVNPDGAEYDISGGTFHSWRKNRQGPGTDPNRNWGYRWGCCGGSSGSTSSETYRGTAAFSAPETRAVSNWVNSRVVGGAQQIKTHIDFHTYSELVLWPFGYTYADTAPGLTAAEAQKFQSLGRQMAATNGYTPQQSSDLYITDGSVNDWMWAQHKIWSFTFEMYPRGSNPGFYPRDTQIVPQTTRNDQAVDILINAAITG
ncbi:M14 family metallopeptidase [Amycolatopsis sp.]|uniref:M14 family metallopeptidase n=1 Tax=Amycolatopsis sp. TaxID=37632 RepID=UPI002D7F4028|nr:M14 family metallopeptidase [Amycolatopsis sp.]HET6703420.1 M14 family metallopeptidase [Amycolatopsis sp.]